MDKKRIRCHGSRHTEYSLIAHAHFFDHFGLTESDNLISTIYDLPAYPSVSSQPVDGFFGPQPRIREASNLAESGEYFFILCCHTIC